MGWLDDLAGFRRFYSRGELVTARQRLNTVGGLVAVDNASGERTDIVMRSALVTELSSLPGSYDKELIRATGFSERLDGGQGTFEWKQGSAVSAVAGMIVSATGGQWFRIYTDYVSPKWMGAKADGTTEDTTAVVLASAYNLVDWGDGTYVTDPAASVITLTSRSGIRWKGTATIKAKGGTTVSGYQQMIKLYNCTDVRIEGLTIDANNSNRSGSGSGCTGIWIEGGSRHWYKNLYLKDFPTDSDGVYMRGSNVASESTYPADIHFENCLISNAGRNGYAVIGCKRLKISGGRIADTRGNPGAGIDIEPNANDTYSAVDVWISDIEFDGNAGEGILVTAADATVRPKRVRVSNVKCRNNTKGAVHLGFAAGCEIDGVMIEDDSTNISNTGYVQLSSVCFDSSVRRVKARNITAAGTSKYVVYVDDSNTGNTIADVDVASVTCSGIAVSSSCQIRGVTLDTVSGIGVTLADGVNQLSDVYARNVTDNVVRAGGVSHDVSNVVINEPSATNQSIRVIAGVSKIRKISVYKTGNAGGGVYPVYYDNGCTIDELSDVHCKATGTAYDRTNTVRLPSTVTTCRMRNVLGTPFLNSATWDPASIANGASATTTVTVSGAAIGDPCRSSHSVSLAGLVSHAFVSAADTVTAVLANSTGGAVDLPSHTVTVEVIK